MTGPARATKSAWAMLGAALLAGLAGSRAAAQSGPPEPTPAPATVRMTAERVADGTWFVQGETALGSAANQNFISNAAFVVTGDGVVVVDALGSPALARRLIALIRERTAEPVKAVVVTHCHADHLYGLQAFKEIGATVFAHAGCREYLASDTAQRRLAASRDELFPWIDETTRLVAADQWLGDGDDPGARDADVVLRLGRHALRLHHAGPAHTVEDVVVHDEATGVLFSGDIVFRGRIPWVGHADSRRWIDAIDRIAAWRPALLVPGHGPVSTTPVHDLALTRDYLVFLRTEMGRAAREMEPFDDAYARTDWSRFESLPLFRAANRMNAYNTYLLMETQASDVPPTPRTPR